MSAPWIASLSEDTKKAITAASLSSGTHLLMSARGIALRLSGVSRTLGKTPFTLMLCGFSSAEALSVARMTADLAAA